MTCFLKLPSLRSIPCKNHMIPFCKRRGYHSAGTLRFN